MKNAILGLLLLFGSLGMAQEADTIDHVTDDDIVVTNSGTAYQATDPTVEHWNPGEQIVIIDGDKMLDRARQLGRDCNVRRIPLRVFDEGELSPPG